MFERADYSRQKYDSGSSGAAVQNVYAFSINDCKSIDRFFTAKDEAT
jgi:hypothetical protein